MSELPKRPYDQVLPLAQRIIDKLAPYCDRVELAGSLRRQCELVSDIEILCIPSVMPDLFGEPMERTGLDWLMENLQAENRITLAKNGDRYKQFHFDSTTGKRYQVDLFVQSEARWGVNMLIRTGSAAFSKAMVTDVSKGGLKPDRYKVRQARVWQDGQALDTPDERTIFELWNLPYVEPHERNGVPARLRAIMDGREKRKV